VSINPYTPEEEHLDHEPSLHQEEHAEQIAETRDNAIASQIDVDETVVEPEPILFSFSGEVPVFLPPLSVVFAKEDNDDGEVPSTVGLPKEIPVSLLQTSSSLNNVRIRALTSNEIHEVENEMVTLVHSHSSHRLHQQEYQYQQEEKKRIENDEQDHTSLDIQLRHLYPDVEIAGGIGIFPPHSKIDVAVSLLNPFRESALSYENLVFIYHSPSGIAHNLRLQHTRLDAHHILTVTIREIPVGAVSGLSSIIVHVTANVGGTPFVLTGSLDFQVS
jgi:hypothetical protein